MNHTFQDREKTLPILKTPTRNDYARKVDEFVESITCESLHLAAAASSGIDVKNAMSHSDHTHEAVTKYWEQARQITREFFLSEGQALATHSLTPEDSDKANKAREELMSVTVKKFEALGLQTEPAQMLVEKFKSRAEIIFSEATTSHIEDDPRQMNTAQLTQERALASRDRKYPYL